MLKKIVLFLVVVFLILFGPVIIVNLIGDFLENLFYLDCSSSSGSAIPLPATTCGLVLFLLLGFYYIWFIIPIPFLIPGALILFVAFKFFRKK